MNIPEDCKRSIQATYSYAANPDLKICRQTEENILQFEVEPRIC
jgi:hypothetical protein